MHALPGIPGRLPKILQDRAVVNPRIAITHPSPGGVGRQGAVVRRVADAHQHLRRLFDLQSLFALLRQNPLHIQVALRRLLFRAFQRVGKVNLGPVVRRGAVTG